MSKFIRDCLQTVIEPGPMFQKTMKVSLNLSMQNTYVDQGELLDVRLLQEEMSDSFVAHIYCPIKARLRELRSQINKLHLHQPEGSDMFREYQSMMEKFDQMEQIMEGKL